MSAGTQAHATSLADAAAGSRACTPDFSVCTAQRAFCLSSQLRPAHPDALWPRIIPRTNHQRRPAPGTARRHGFLRPAPCRNDAPHGISCQYAGNCWQASYVCCLPFRSRSASPSASPSYRPDNPPPSACQKAARSHRRCGALPVSHSPRQKKAQTGRSPGEQPVCCYLIRENPPGLPLSVYA